jgi:hypothetical protein
MGENALDHTRKAKTCVVLAFLLITLAVLQATAPSSTRISPAFVTVPSTMETMLNKPHRRDRNKKDRWERAQREANAGKNEWVNGTEPKSDN